MPAYYLASDHARVATLRRVCCSTILENLKNRYFLRITLWFRISSLLRNRNFLAGNERQKLKVWVIITRVARLITTVYSRNPCHVRISIRTRMHARIVCAHTHTYRRVPKRIELAGENAVGGPATGKPATRNELSGARSITRVYATTHTPARTFTFTLAASPARSGPSPSLHSLNPNDPHDHHR